MTQQVKGNGKFSTYIIKCIMQENIIRKTIYLNSPKIFRWKTLCYPVVLSNSFLFLYLSAGSPFLIAVCLHFQGILGFCQFNYLLFTSEIWLLLFYGYSVNFCIFHIKGSINIPVSFHTVKFGEFFMNMSTVCHHTFLFHNANWKETNNQNKQRKPKNNNNKKQKCWTNQLVSC